MLQLLPEGAREQDTRYTEWTNGCLCEWMHESESLERSLPNPITPKQQQKHPPRSTLVNRSFSAYTDLNVRYKKNYSVYILISVSVKSQVRK